MPALPDEPTRQPLHIDQAPADVTAVPGPTQVTPAGPVAVEPPGFEILDELARGGMGVVYRAHDRVFQREVAVKVLLPEWRDLPEAVSRFGTEARITGQLQHPGVPPVHDLGTMPDGRPFLAMKLIRGRTLSDLLKERATPADDLPRFLQAFEQICQAVGYAHAKGIVHRDIKPQNVMVGAFGEVQVMDWGLAKEMASRERERPEDAGTRIEPVQPESSAVTPQSAARLPTPQDSDLTRAGSIIGTPMYMPPEQARGELNRVGPWSDVFSLGGLLCLILTGKPPYSGNRHQVLTFAELGMVEEAFTRLDGCGADAELVALCKRCLARDTADRPADGKIVADAIAAYRTGVEARLRAAESAKAAAEARAVEEANTRREAVAKVAEQRKKRRWQLAALGTVALLLLAAGAFAWWQDNQDAKHRAEQVRIENERLADELKQQAERERVAQAERERLDRNRQVIDGMLDQTAAELKAEDFRAAATLLSEAEKRFPDGGADQLRPRFARLQTELTMLRELDRIDTLRWTSVRGEFQDVTADKQLPAAFQRYGIDPKTMTRDDIVARINSSPIRERLIGSLDRWLFRFKTVENATEVLVVLRAVDPDEFRDEFRVVVAELAFERLPVLANKPSARTQPPRFAILLSAAETIPINLRLDILLETHLRKPNDLPLLMTIGGLYPVEQKPGASQRISWYRAALAVRPDHTAAWNGLGIAQRDFGDLIGAADSFREAIRCDPLSPVARNNLAVALGDMREFDDAVCVLRASVRVDPEDAHTWYTMGTILNHAGKPKQAADALRTAIKCDATDAWAHYNLGFVLEDLDDPAGAEAEYRAALKYDPNHASAHFNLGILLFARKDYAGAIEQYKAALGSRPEHANTHYNLGNALFAKGDVDDAILAYRSAIKYDPKHADAFGNLGVALEKKGKRDDAIAAYREAVKWNPEKYAELAKKLPPEKK